MGGWFVYGLAHKHAGSAASRLLPHCATAGAWHVISQRLPSTTALHMLPVLPTIEFVTAPVPPVSIELETLDELFEMIELVTPVEVFELTELEDSLITEFCAEAQVHSPSATTVKRCRMSVSSGVAIPVLKH